MSLSIALTLSAAVYSDACSRRIFDHCHATFPEALVSVTLVSAERMGPIPFSVRLRGKRTPGLVDWLQGLQDDLANRLNPKAKA